MAPITVVEERPEFVLGEMLQIGDEVDGNRWGLLVEQRLREVVVINDKVSSFRPDDPLERRDASAVSPALPRLPRATGDV
jgi:hypothetical protein